MSHLNRPVTGQTGRERFASEARRGLAVLLILGGFCGGAKAVETPAAADFRKNIQPILSKYCYDCHGDGEKKGEIAFDEFKTDHDLTAKPELWLEVLKNTRPGLMPPGKKPRPTAEEQKRLEDWIKYQAFGLDPANPDPGRVTIRRLNRGEYSNTIRDLMGVDFHADQEFPPDDTGYGFDDIGDVLTISPMLLEKYLAAAQTIVAEAVPTVSKVVPERVIPGLRFRRAGAAGNGRGNGRGNKPATFLALSFYNKASVTNSFQIEQEGDYQLVLDLTVKGMFDFDPGKCRVAFKVDGRELLQKEFGWYANKEFHFPFDQKWAAGGHQMTVELEPLTSTDDQINSIDLRVVSATIRGPMDQKFWTRPKNYDRFFTGDEPRSPVEKRQTARQILAGFAAKAFRRPADDETVDRLVALAERFYNNPEHSFQDGVGHAIMAVLASPRFLFRIENPAPGASPRAPFVEVDEYALASRLSYFLWSTMPDEELFDLARRGELRKNLPAQLKRMLADSRAEKMVQNFTGQWLETRDLPGATINERVVLARDDGNEKQIREQREAFLRRQAKPTAQTNMLSSTNLFSSTNLLSSAGASSFSQTNGAGGTNRLARRNGNGGNRIFGPPRVQLNADLKTAMRLETEMFFSHVVREDRSVTELIDSDYTFLNQALAKLYGITNVTGTEMRRVELPADSPRGGVLTDGSILVVTSNPDRTSPVKRGLFVLQNFLGTPAPPPPPNIPALEAAEKDIKDHEPTLRETLEAHRAKPLCASCHNRMDPIGLAFENFNALGMWREKERNQSIDAAGKLITGETFSSVRELKRVLVEKHRMDFYRCLTAKLLTYALGRGLEYYDTETLDQIVARLDRDSGRFSALLTGIIESAPFQKERNPAYRASLAASEPAGNGNPGPLAQSRTKL